MWGRQVADICAYSFIKWLIRRYEPPLVPGRGERSPLLSLREESTREASTFTAVWRQQHEEGGLEAQEEVINSALWNWGRLQGEEIFALVFWGVHTNRLGKPEVEEALQVEGTAETRRAAPGRNFAEGVRRSERGGRLGLLLSPPCSDCGRGGYGSRWPQMAAEPLKGGQYVLGIEFWLLLNFFTCK